MRELTFEEMDQVAGGNVVAWTLVDPSPTSLMMMKALNYLWDNKEAYFNYLIQCSAQYGGGPFDYRLGS